MVTDERRYPFIAVEGTDGSGKSTLRNLIHQRLNETGYGCFMVGQHSWLDVDAGRVILAARLQRAGIRRSEITAAYSRDKMLHLRHNIVPALRTVAVLADRYIYSDAVYHEVLYGIPAEETLAAHERLGSIRPDAVIFVDSAPEVAFARTITRGMHRRPHETESTIEGLYARYRELFLGGHPGAHALNLIHVDNNTLGPVDAADRILPALIDLFPSPPDLPNPENVVVHDC